MLVCYDLIILIILCVTRCLGHLVCYSMLLLLILVSTQTSCPPKPLPVVALFDLRVAFISVFLLDLVGGFIVFLGAQPK